LNATISPARASLFLLDMGVDEASERKGRARWALRHTRMPDGEGYTHTPPHMPPCALFWWTFSDQLPPAFCLPLPPCYRGHMALLSQKNAEPVGRGPATTFLPPYCFSALRPWPTCLAASGLYPFMPNLPCMLLLNHAPWTGILTRLTILTTIWTCLNISTSLRT